jgi:hypothetical protein
MEGGKQSDHVPAYHFRRRDNRFNVERQEE